MRVDPVGMFIGDNIFNAVSWRFSAIRGNIAKCVWTQVCIGAHLCILTNVNTKVMIGFWWLLESYALRGTLMPQKGIKERESRKRSRWEGDNERSLNQCNSLPLRFKRGDPRLFWDPCFWRRKLCRSEYWSSLSLIMTYDCDSGRCILYSHETSVCSRP